MGLILEPEGVDFVINSGPLTDQDRAEISEFIRKHREEARKRLASELLALCEQDRAQFAYQLLSSLAAAESDSLERSWATTAKAEFERLHPFVERVRTRSKMSRGRKPTRSKR